MATGTINGMTEFGSSSSGADAGWDDIGAGPGAGQNTDDFIEGTDSFGGRKTADGRGLEYSATSVDMSGANTHIYVWINCKSIGALDLLASGGMRLRASSTAQGASNFRTWFIGGRDTILPGWQLYVVDVSKPGSISDSGTFNTNDVESIGVELQFNTAPGGNSDNILMDVIRYSTGPYVTGGTSGDRLLWSDVIAASEASAFGVVESKSGVIFVNGQMALGAPSGSGDCYLDDQGQIIVWKSQEYEDGTEIVSSLATDYNAFIIQEGSGTTDIEDGVLVGSGDTKTGVQGSIFQKSLIAIDGGVSTNDIRFDNAGPTTALDLHGTTFSNFDSSLTFSNDATDGPNHIIAGVVFSACEQIIVNRPEFRSCLFAGYTGVDAAIVWNANADVENSQFLNNTDGTNNPAGVEHPAAGTFIYDLLKFLGNDFDIFNPNNATVEDNYADSNRDGVTVLQTGAKVQGFTVGGSDAELSSAEMSLAKTGTPTGTLTYGLYDDGGGEPGNLLATSEGLDVTTLDGTQTLIELSFNNAGQITLSASTVYYIGARYDDGDGGNNIRLGEDQSSPTHAGTQHLSADEISWSTSADDLIFSLRKDGIVTITSVDSDPTLLRNTGSPVGCIVVNNAVNLTVNVEDQSGSAIQDAQVAIFDSSDVQLMNEDTTAGGVATETYNYLGDEAITVRVRKNSPSATRYIPVMTTGLITSTGFTLTVVLIEDTIAA